MEYTYTDFHENLDDVGKRIAETLRNHIAENHAEYKPYGISPKSLHFRKYAKHGKPLCSLFSNNGSLSVRFMLYSSAVHEVLIRQNEFGERVRKGLVQACKCKGCGYYGDPSNCWCQHHYFINNELLYGCNTSWYTIENINDDDICDLLYLADLQSKHMSHNARDSRGAGYNEDNISHCGEVKIVRLEQIELNIDDFESADKRIDKYTNDYNFTPMGEHGGLWYYFDKNAACTTIPDGFYAMITVSDPLKFSAERAWDYICLWIRQNDKTITSANKLIKFFKHGGNQFMEMYVPIMEE